MIKKIIFIFLLSCLIVSCGKKSDPEYKDLDQEVGKIIIFTNKA